VFSSDRSHLVGGRFDPGAMVDGLCSAIDEALKEGFGGLCATGDMRWELGADENFDHLLEYEARLEKVFRERPLRGICQYHRSLVPANAVRDALVTHRTTYLGEKLNRDNLFYVPPEVLLAERNAGGDVGDWMCQQILRVLDAERERDQLLRDLERLVAERTSELQAANRHLESFSYSVSHDLRAPLRAIDGFAQALASEHGHQLDEQGRKYLDRIVGGAKRMGDLIEGMLAMGRVLKTEMQRAVVDVTSLAEDVARELRDGQPARAVDLVIAPGMQALADRVLVRAVLVNLMGNAWKFTSRSARPRIEVWQSGEEAGFAVFSVRDNGAGFDMQYAGKLFGAFQRLHRQDEFPGTGVGLATVDRIVSRHGGRIWAEGQPGQGATFRFTLPQVVAASDRDEGVDD
jgi:signal transduction histidine kinase